MMYREPSTPDDYAIRGGSFVRIVHDSNHADQALVGYVVRVSKFYLATDPPGNVRLCYGGPYGVSHPKSDIVLCTTSASPGGSDGPAK